jgi:chemotaxis protein CheX
MSVEVALIDFPRLQEQIAARLLACDNLNAQSITSGDAASRLELFNLVLFFWPDTGVEVRERFRMLVEANTERKIPILLVASEVGKRNAETSLAKSVRLEVLTTPLLPHLVTQKIHDVLGIQKPISVVHSTLDVGYVNPFVVGAANTLKQMVGLDCERTNLELRHDARAHGEISGVMNLSGDVEGFVAVTFSSQLARKIVCRMLRIQLGEETEDDMIDGVGEMVNMIAGSAKAELVHTKHSFKLSLPNVIVGGPHGLGQPRDGTPAMVIRFMADGDPFELVVCMKPRRRD